MSLATTLTDLGSFACSVLKLLDRVHTTCLNIYTATAIEKWLLPEDFVHENCVTAWWHLLWWFVMSWVSGYKGASNAWPCFWTFCHWKPPVLLYRYFALCMWFDQVRRIFHWTRNSAQACDWDTLIHTVVDSSCIIMLCWLRFMLCDRVTWPLCVI